MRTVHALMSSVLDYAGLYPPAQHDPPTTVDLFTSVHESKRQWMLGRLIWPAAKLDELTALAPRHAPVATAPETLGAWAISCVMSPAGSPEARADFARIGEFNARHEREGEPAMRIDAIEMRGESAASIERGLSDIPDDLFPYFEIPLDADPRGLIAALVGEEAGVKFRTGGTTPEAHPAAGDLARALVACADAGVPFKATAGLHRALCHFNHAAGARQLGFLNVFIGAALAYEKRIDVEGLTEFLNVESVEDLNFSDSAISWQSARVSINEITETRGRFAHSFGSCSFDEPWQDLVAMELVRAVVAGDPA